MGKLEGGVPGRGWIFFIAISFFVVVMMPRLQVLRMLLLRL